MIRMTSSARRPTVCASRLNPDCVVLLLVLYVSSLSFVPDASLYASGVAWCSASGAARGDDIGAAMRASERCCSAVSHAICES